MKGIYYWIPAAVRNEVAKRDRGVCQHCGKKATKAEVNKRGILTFFDENGRSFHLDHKKSVANGGEHTAKNIVLSCENCNLSQRKRKLSNDNEIKSILEEFK